jgi:ectoine hydroxylase
VNQQLGLTAREPFDAYPSRKGQPGHFLPRIDPVVYASDCSTGPLPVSRVEQYEKQGFIVLDNVFSATEIERLQHELHCLRASARERSDETYILEPSDDSLRSIFAVHESNALFGRLASDARLVEVASFLLGEQVYIHQSRLNYKPGFKGREFYWHSDFETWHVEDGMPSMRALSISITLTPNTPNNGPLMLIPGSHKRYVACSGTTPKDHFRESLREQKYGTPPEHLLAELVDAGGIVAVDAQPGSVIIFDCNTMHGSNGNITPDPRSNAFIVYNAISNQVTEPFCDRPPRPEYLCSRKTIRTLRASAGAFGKMANYNQLENHK